MIYAETGSWLAYETVRQFHRRLHKQGGGLRQRNRKTAEKQQKNKKIIFKELRKSGRRIQ